MEQEEGKGIIIFIIIVLVVSAIVGGTIYWLNYNQKTISCKFVSTIVEYKSGIIPTEFPPQLFYPKSKIKEVLDSRVSLKQISMTMETSDKMKKVYDYYINVSKKNNWKTNEAKFNEPITTLFVAGNKFSATINIDKNDIEKKTGISIVVSLK